MLGLTVIEVFERPMASGIATHSATPVRRATFPASQQIITIGNGSGNDLKLPDKSVSHYHAVLVRGEMPEQAHDGLLRDLSTVNGTFAPHADVSIDQLVFQGGVTAYMGPYRLEITLDGEADDWDRVSYSNAWDRAAPEARCPGALTLRKPGPADPLLERHPSRSELILEAQRHLGRTRHRRTILDWLVRSIAHKLVAPDSVLRIQCGRQVFAATPTFIDAPVAAKNAIDRKQPFVSDHLLIVPLLEGNPARVAGDWTLKRGPHQEPFTDDDASFLIDLAKWVLAACPAEPTEQCVTLSAQRWPITIAGASKSFREMMEKVRAAGDSSLRVLLTGPVGSGKTRLAEAIHRISGREGKFVEVNAATGDPLTIEFLIFGGRLVDIDRTSRPGKLEKADGGTLFLDEIADMPDRTQNMLKAPTGDARDTVLHFMRILDPEMRRTDVRIITATSKDLDELVRKGKFDPALLSRIKDWVIPVPPLRTEGSQGDSSNPRVVSVPPLRTEGSQGDSSNPRVVSVPPLADRRDDILLLAHFFLDGFAARDREMPLRLSQTAKAAILRAPWKANVRGLANAMAAAYERVIKRRGKGIVAGQAGAAAGDGKGAGRPEMVPVAEVRANSAGRQNGPADRGAAARLPGEIQVDDLELEHDAASVESPADPALASAREAAIDAVLSVLRDVDGERKAALVRIGTTETTLNQTLDNWCIPREYGHAEADFSDDERNDRELVQAAMKGLAEPVTRWGLAPKDLKPFYARVMTRLAEDGIHFTDVEAFAKRLDGLWIPRHYPCSTEEVRDYWRQEVKGRAERKDEQRRGRRKPLPPKDPGEAQPDSVPSC